MIILDERNYLKPELEDKGFSFFDFYDEHQVLDMKSFKQLELKRRSDFLLVDTETILKHPEDLETFKSILNTFVGAVFFYDQKNEKARTWIQNEGGFLTKIIGEHGLPMPQLNWTILSNQLQFMWNLIVDQKNLQEHMVRFSQELDLVLQNADQEMQKAKKIHETLVPRRAEEIKGVNFLNRYSAGDGGGGEFYDLMQTPSKVYQILLSSQSYLMTSAIMGLLSQHRGTDFNVESFINDAQAEIATINSSKKKKSEADLLVLELDLNTLGLTALTESKTELYSLNKGQLKLKKGETQALGKGEKLVILSPGFLFNWKEGQAQKNILEFTKNHANMVSHELMSELFFQIKSADDSAFLKKDATVVMMEVNRHGIHKV